MNSHTDDGADGGLSFAEDQWNRRRQDAAVRDRTHMYHPVRDNPSQAESAVTPRTSVSSDQLREQTLCVSSRSVVDRHDGTRDRPSGFIQNETLDGRSFGQLNCLNLGLSCPQSNRDHGRCESFGLCN